MLEVKGEKPRIWARVERLMDHLGMGIFPCTVQYVHTELYNFY
jgi:hypothetical protein